MSWIKKVSLTAVLLAGSAVASVANDPQVEPIRLLKSYIPTGFDNNDKAQLVVAGQFQNACYKIGPYAFEVNKEDRQISVRQDAYHHPGFCAQVVTPFTQVIELGPVEEGSYQIYDATSGMPLGTLRIEKSAPEEDLYAPISDTFITFDESVPVLNLKGTFTDRCMRLKEVRVLYSEDVIVALPLAEYVGTPHNCGHERIRFQHQVPLSKDLQGTYLLHVRALGGQAINRIVEILATPR